MPSTKRKQPSRSTSTHPPPAEAGKSGTRSAARGTSSREDVAEPRPAARAPRSGRYSDLPPLDAQPPVAPKEDPELESRVFSLVTAVQEQDGMAYPPAWTPIADIAKRRGYLKERSLRLYIKDHGKQWLSNRASPGAGRGASSSGTTTYTMTKINPRTRLQLKDLSHDTGVPMQEAIGHIIAAVHEHRDELTRIARAARFENPWEAIGVLVKRKA